MAAIPALNAARSSPFSSIAGLNKLLLAVYGLAANVWCNDPVEARRIAQQIRAGTVWINGGGAMRPDAPFGGYGRSGVGRELGEWGMREYLEVKHIQWRV